MSKPVWLMLVFLFALEFIPKNINKKEKFIFDRPRNEGYVAFIVNEKDEYVDEPTEKCKCNGSEVIVHGDGHKTPCQCLNTGSKICECAKEKSQAVELEIIKQIVLPPEVKVDNTTQPQNNEDDNSRRRFRFRR